MYTQHRDEFLARVALAMAPAPAHVAIGIARKLLRYASTLQRLAVAQCNGDWPADNGQRTVTACPLCEQCWAPSAITGGPQARQAHSDVNSALGVIRRAIAEPSYCRALLVDIDSCEGKIWSAYISARACPDCRISATVRALVRAYLPQYQAVFSNDPRGYVVRLAPASATHEEIDTGRAPIIYVPGRE